MAKSPRSRSKTTPPPGLEGLADHPGWDPSPDPAAPADETVAPSPAAASVPSSPTASDGDDPVLRQNAPLHCPYCKKPCESKSDALFTTYRCVNNECGIPYSQKVARPRLSDRLGRRSANDALSAR